MISNRLTKMKYAGSLQVTFLLMIAALFLSSGVFAQSTEEVAQREAKTIDILSRIDAFAEEDERLRHDSAVAHYNMGNIYFQKGEFEIASREYYQAVALMPDDPDAHYNLAFVSSEHLRDYKTALKHYQMYLYLKPDARDAHLVKEKIVFAQLKLQAVTNSPLEKSLEKSLEDKR